jgi:acetyl-CoA carboxylase biotin carboxyl carrier protein
MTEKLELLARRDGDRVVLTSPEVGLFTCALAKGQLLAAGASAGSIRSLGRSFELVVPAGVAGRIVTNEPERVHEPVGYGTTLYELAPLDATAGADEPAAAEAHAGAPAFRAPYSGRFWHRPTPQDPAFVEVGTVIEPGQTIGLIEVMKTFTQLTYTPGADLPQRARVTRFAVADGSEVTEGDALLEVERA